MSAASSVFMVRPVNFGFNQQTAESNAFQIYDPDQLHTQEKALKEFDDLVELLRAEHVEVITINDTVEPHTPDSIFPNNWISTHANGDIIIYPMQAENRRLEKRSDIFTLLKNNFDVKTIIDLSYFEQQNKFLEGTGSMVLDHNNKIAYACTSPRTHPDALKEFSNLSGFKIVAFTSVDELGKAIYHTNVMMCITEHFAVICLDSIKNRDQKKRVTTSLTNTGKDIINISYDQMNNFAGNMLELKNKTGTNLLVMSERAFKSLTINQLSLIQKFNKIIYSALTTIENTGGGSARCMIAEIHLPEKANLPSSV